MRFTTHRASLVLLLVLTTALSYLPTTWAHYTNWDDNSFIAWVTERKDVLYGLFYMASLNAYLRYRVNQKMIWFMLSFVLGLLSMLAKPMAYSLPLVMLLCDW